MFQQGTESPWATQRQRWQLDSLKLSPAAGHLPQALLVVPTLASLHPVTYLCFLCLHQARLASEQAYLFVKYDRLPKKPLAQQCWQPIVTAQTGGGIMFSGCPSVRLSVCYTNWWTRYFENTWTEFDASWHKVVHGTRARNGQVWDSWGQRSRSNDADD